MQKRDHENFASETVERIWEVFLGKQRNQGFQAWR